MSDNVQVHLDGNSLMTRRLFLTAALLILLVPQLLFAQDTAIEFYGTIQSANTTAIVINGQIVDIQSAQINAPLTVGSIVRVKASGNADTLTALEIESVTPGIIPGIVEIDGVVSGFYNCGIVIGDFQIDSCDAETQDTILVGHPYRVFAFATTPGHWTALLVTEADDLPPAATPDVLSPAATPDVVAPVATPDVVAPVITPEVAAPVSTPEVFAPASTPEVGEDFKISGTLQSFTDADLVVDGQRFFTGGARIDGVLTVGAQVQLEIRVVNGQCQWVLAEVKVANGSDNSGSDDHGGSNSGSGSSGDDGSGNSGRGSGGKGGGDGSGGRGGGSNSGSDSSIDHSGKGG
jgi:hypothetical protein